MITVLAVGRIGPQFKMSNSEREWSRMAEIRFRPKDGYFETAVATFSIGPGDEIGNRFGGY